MFIGDHDIERVRNVVFTRNFAGDDASSYPDSVKEKEVAWVVLYSKMLKSEAEKYNFPFIEIEKNDNDLQKVLKALRLPEA